MSCSVEHFKLDSHSVRSRDVSLSKTPLHPCSYDLFSYLSDIPWTSCLSCRKHPGSASMVYTWQLCFSEGWLELEGEAAQLETSGLKRSLLTAKEMQKARGWCLLQAASPLPYHGYSWRESQSTS